jgi:hypothetical protein
MMLSFTDPMQTGVIKSAGEADRIRIWLTLTYMKGVAQSVKNDRIIPALGQQGLVGQPHCHLRSQDEEPSC